jgi:hypothetical protein
MNELVQQLASRLGISEDKARMAAETVLSFVKNKVPALGSQLDSFVQGGQGVAGKASDVLRKTG